MSAGASSSRRPFSLDRDRRPDRTARRTPVVKNQLGTCRRGLDGSRCATAMTGVLTRASGAATPRSVRRRSTTRKNMNTRPHSLSHWPRLRKNSMSSADAAGADETEHRRGAQVEFEVVERVRTERRQDLWHHCSAQHLVCDAPLALAASTGPMSMPSRVSAVSLTITASEKKKSASRPQSAPMPTPSTNRPRPEQVGDRADDVVEASAGSGAGTRYGLPILVDHSASGSATMTPPVVPSTASWSVSMNADARPLGEHLAPARVEQPVEDRVVAASGCRSASAEREPDRRALSTVNTISADTPTDRERRRLRASVGARARFGRTSRRRRRSRSEPSQRGLLGHRVVGGEAAAVDVLEHLCVARSLPGPSKTSSPSRRPMMRSA